VHGTACLDSGATLFLFKSDFNPSLIASGKATSNIHGYGANMTQTGDLKGRALQCSSARIEGANTRLPKIPDASVGDLRPSWSCCRRPPRSKNYVSIGCIAKLCRCTLNVYCLLPGCPTAIKVAVRMVVRCGAVGKL
jgi:hypothetical protein